MGNSIISPNIIFAKFYVCKKALKTGFFSQFYMEKDLLVIYFFFRGLLKLFFSFPFLQPLARRTEGRGRRRCHAAVCPLPPLRADKGRGRRALLLLSLTPLLACSLFLFPPNTRNPNPAPSAARRRRCSRPRAPPSAPLAPPSSSPPSPLRNRG